MSKIACATILQFKYKNVEGDEAQSIFQEVDKQDASGADQNSLDARSSTPYLKVVYDRLQNLKELDPKLPLKERLNLLAKNDFELFNALMNALPEIIEMERVEIESQSLWTDRVKTHLDGTYLLPKEAPALWAKDKLPGDTPPDFIQRHYAPWLGKGFSQATLRHLDPQAEKAWRHWKRKNDTPAWFDLPTKSEQLARDSSKLAPPGSSEAKAIRRLGWRMSKQHSR